MCFGLELFGGVAADPRGPRGRQSALNFPRGASTFEVVLFVAPGAS